MQLTKDTVLSNGEAPLTGSNNVQDVASWDVLISTNQGGAGDGIVQSVTFTFSADVDLGPELLQGSFWWVN